MPIRKETVAIGDYQLVVDVNPSLASRLHYLNHSLLIGLRDAHQSILIGSDGKGSAVVSIPKIAPCLALACNGSELWVATHDRITRYRDVLFNPEERDGFDAVFAPLSVHFTGVISIRDFLLADDGAVFFAAARINAISRPSLTHSFDPFWLPHFFNEMSIDDRIHLNGLAGKGGRPAVASCFSDGTDWRNDGGNRGVLVDTKHDHIICGGLQMPHSPRFLGEDLFFLQSGRGTLCKLEPNGSLVEIITRPGFLRSLEILGDIAFIGVSPLRSGTPMDLASNENNLMDADASGVDIVDLNTGVSKNAVRIKGASVNIGAICLIPGHIDPAVLPCGEMAAIDTITFDGPVTFN